MINQVELANIAEQVKVLMDRLGLERRECELPAIEFYSSVEHGLPLNFAVYSPVTHTIYINSDAKDLIEENEGALEEIIAHELTHAFQNLPATVLTDVFSDDYWTQRHEQEAYAIGTLWQAVYGICANHPVGDNQTLAQWHEEFINTTPLELVLNHYVNLARDSFLEQTARTV